MLSARAHLVEVTARRPTPRSRSPRRDDGA
jgi:hypothetical protein